MNSQPENMSSQSAEEIVATSHEPIVEPPQFEGDIQDLLDRAETDPGAPFEQDSLSGSPHVYVGKFGLM